MEELNKNQLILLALLVSFVTSIATGIVTVSLMEQAPQSVTQTINRVVTRTIESVSKEPATVVMATEEDLITSAVEKNSRGAVKIRLGEEGDVVGYGTVISQEGMIVSDINPDEFSEEVKYYGVYDDGKEFPISFVKYDKAGFSLFSSQFGDDKKNPYKPNYLNLSDSSKLKIGQTVLVVSPETETLQKGLISGLVRDDAADTATTTDATPVVKDVKSIKLIKLSITLSKENSGSPLVNLDGGVIGITIYRDGSKIAIPSNIIKDSISSLAQKDPLKK